MEISVVSSFAEKEVIKPAVRQQFVKSIEKSCKKSAYNICSFGKSL